MANYLNSAQISSYYEDGCLFPVTVMGTGTAQSHRQRLEAAESKHGPQHYKPKPYLYFTSAAEISRNPAVLDAVESILGPDILLWDAAYVIKEPRNTAYVSWHQDLTYWGLESDNQDDIVSVRVALSKATRDNGCMQMVRATHRQGNLSTRIPTQKIICSIAARQSPINFVKTRSCMWNWRPARPRCIMAGWCIHRIPTRRTIGASAWY